MRLREVNFYPPSIKTTIIFYSRTTVDYITIVSFLFLYDNMAKTAFKNRANIINV